MPADRQRILIVDDSDLDVEFLRVSLAGEYDIHMAGNGHLALTRAAAIMPDLILLDILMPDLNGFDVCRRLKADPVTRDIPVIFLTSLSAKEDEVHGLELGGIDYITKPFRGPMVQVRVRNHLLMKRQRDELQRLTTLDPVTGLVNRRGFGDVLEREWLRAVHIGEPLSLLMIDIDQFKPYNDRYGHVAGDACLQRIGRALSTGVGRAGDVMARYGGEEFACILPDTDPAGAIRVAQRLRLAVEALAIPHAGVRSRVTVSVGGATAMPHMVTMADALLQAADEQLYAAKRAGRNAVCCAVVSAEPISSA